jgi:predicted RecB family endonuclease
MSFQVNHCFLSEYFNSPSLSVFFIRREAHQRELTSSALISSLQLGNSALQDAMSVASQSHLAAVLALRRARSELLDARSDLAEVLQDLEQFHFDKEAANHMLTHLQGVVADRAVAHHAARVCQAAAASPSPPLAQQLCEQPSILDELDRISSCLDAMYLRSLQTNFYS